VLICPNCGRDNPEGFQFCGYCTAALTPAPLAGLEERKVVTVLFCDLVGFTARSDQADPEDVRARIRPYHARLRLEIERFGGTVEKFIGDAVMAVYGAPVAHEDDAERAVRSALRIIETIEELNEATPGLGLSVRVGINTGEAVVALGARPSQGEGIVTGDVVNVASRLQGAAPVGGIVVGEQTYRMTEGVFDYQPLEPVVVKGKAEPIAIWRALASRSRFGTDITRTHATAMVGREVERGLLTGLFSRSVRDGSVQLATIVGEPGVGKSRLVAELFSFVDSSSEVVRWRQGRCLPYGEGITFWALAEIVKAEAGILESDPSEVAASKLDAVLPDGSEREWLRQRLLPLIGLEASSTAEREELFTAWRKFLESLAEQRPSVFVFEDLHWADPAMLAFLEHLADWSEGVPILLVGTARPELYESQPTWASAARNATRINLAPLSENETAVLISLLLEQAVLPAEVQSVILERAGGNPLYAEEFVRLLRDRGLLVRQGRTLVLSEGAEVPFPEGIQALIAARLDTLPAERKQLLQDAAVIGKVFWAGAVAAMGDLEPGAVRDALHELARKELARPARISSMEGEAEYSFFHILVRDVAYSQIPRAGRVAKHRRAASWIESVAGERVEDHAEILAYHYTAALEAARAGGQTEVAKELEAPALRFLLLAGDRALGLDTVRAEANYAKALDLSGPGQPERAEVLVRWADAIRQAGRDVDAIRVLEEAIGLFKEHGDAVGAARAMTMLAEVHWSRGDARSRQVVDEAVGLLESEPPGPALVAAYVERARLECLRGENREAIEGAKRAMALASLLGLEEPARALGYLGLARCDLGDAGGLDDVRRALVLSIERGKGREAAVLYNNLARLLWVIEGPAAALGAYDEGIEFAERRGIAEFAVWMASGRLSSLFDLGSWDQVLEVASSILDGLRDSGSYALFHTLEYRARVTALRGGADDLLSLAESAIEIARNAGSIEHSIPALAFAAAVRFWTGDLQGTRDLLSELERTPHYQEASSYASLLPGMVRAAVGAGDRAVAERLAGGFEPIHRYQEHALCASRAILAEGRGEAEEGARLYAEAAGRWERFGVVPERGFALLGEGRCLLALERPAEAVEVLRVAREGFLGLGAKPALAETDALLEQATALIA
jgi:class 3 adenylate cyclase/tetratricopeptide (TPR) repeat protein